MGRHVRHFVRRCAPALLVLAALLLVPSLAAAVPEWEPMPPGLLLQAHSAIDSSAGSELVTRHVWAENTWSSAAGFGVTYDAFERIKVYSAAGAERWAQVKIDEPEHGALIRDLEVRTIRPDGSVENAAAGTPRPETVFDEDGEKRTQWSFAPRGVVPGCVIEYRYRVELYDAALHFSWLPLQFDVPAHEVRYELTPIATIPFYYLALRAKPEIVKDLKHNRFTFTLHDVPALRDEPDMPHLHRACAAVVVYYSENEQRQPADFWPRIGRDDDAPFATRTTPDRAARRLVADSLAAGDVLDRLQRIVEWCRTRLRVVPYNSDSLVAAKIDVAGDGPEALRRGVCTVEQANLALATLCRAAGFDVRLLRCEDRTECPFQQDMMSAGLLPGVETAVRFRGSWLPLSALARFGDWDALPWEEEGGYALVCDRDSTCFILTPLAPAEASATTRTLDLTLQGDGTLEGEMRLAFSGHWNGWLRGELEPGALTLQQVIERRHFWTASECEVSALAADNLDRPREPLRVHAHVRIHDHAVPGAKRLLLEPAVLRAHAQPRFSSSERQFEVAFDFAHAEVDTIRVHVGASWKPEPPAPIRALDAGDLGSYAAGVSADGGTVTYTRTLRVAPAGTLTFPPSAYPDIRRFFDAVHERDRVTLTFAPADKP